MEGCFELSIGNADKGLLPLEEIKRRVAQFTQAGLPLVVTQAPLFSQKAELFPKSMFVVGYDTAVRLVRADYYGDDTAMLLQVKCCRGGTSSMHDNIGLRMLLLEHEAFEDQHLLKSTWAAAPTVPSIKSTSREHSLNTRIVKLQSRQHTSLCNMRFCAATLNLGMKRCNGGSTSEYSMDHYPHLWTLCSAVCQDAPPGVWFLGGGTC